MFNCFHLSPATARAFSRRYRGGVALLSHTPSPALPSIPPSLLTEVVEARRVELMCGICLLRSRGEQGAEGGAGSRRLPLTLKRTPGGNSWERPVMSLSACQRDSPGLRRVPGSQSNFYTASADGVSLARSCTVEREDGRRVGGWVGVVGSGQSGTFKAWIRQKKRHPPSTHTQAHSQPAFQPPECVYIQCQTDTSEAVHIYFYKSCSFSHYVIKCKKNTI